MNVGDCLVAVLVVGRVGDVLLNTLIGVEELHGVRFAIDIVEFNARLDIIVQEELGACDIE